MFLIVGFFGILMASIKPKLTDVCTGWNQCVPITANSKASSVNTEDFRENAWLEGQQLCSVNSGVGTENMPGLECNQETYSPLKLTWGWTTDKYWKNLWSWFYVCAWGYQDAFPKDHNMQQFIRNAQTQRYWVALTFLLICIAEMGLSRMRHGHLI